MFFKTITKAQEKFKKIEIMYQNPIYMWICGFLDVAKFADSRWKNADVSRTQGVCHVIYAFFGTSLGKV